MHFLEIEQILTRCWCRSRSTELLPQWLPVPHRQVLHSSWTSPSLSQVSPSVVWHQQWCFRKKSLLRLPQSDAVVSLPQAASRRFSLRGLLPKESQRPVRRRRRGGKTPVVWGVWRPHTMVRWIFRPRISQFCLSSSSTAPAQSSNNPWGAPQRALTVTKWQPGEERASIPIYWGISMAPRRGQGQVLLPGQWCKTPMAGGQCLFVLWHCQLPAGLAKMEGNGSHLGGPPLNRHLHLSLTQTQAPR